nr:uncharacterized mitochondrial protein AtMg00810-like [Tanacetum cinerariifolium]
MQTHQWKLKKPMLKDEDCGEVDVHMYRSMIGSLMYLTSSKPDIMFVVCACARYQVNPKVSHLHAMKRNFRYLKGHPKLGLWYPKDSPFDLVAYTDSDYARASLDRKSTIGGITYYCQLEVNAARHNLLLLVNVNFWSTAKAKTINEEAHIHAKVDGKKRIITKSSVRRGLRLAAEEGNDCLSNSTILEQLALMGPKTTAWNEFSSTMESAIICLATGQKFTFSKWIFDSMIRNLDNVSRKFLMYPRRIGKGFSGRVTPLFPTMVVQHQAKIDEAVHKELDDRMVRASITSSSLEAEQDNDNIDKTQSKATPNDSSSQGTDSGSGLRCQEAIRDTIVQTRFENVSKLSNDSLLTKTTQANAIASLKRRVKKIEMRNRSRTHKLKRLYKGRRIDDIDADEDITLVSVQVDADIELFVAAKDLGGEEVFVEQEVVTDKEEIYEVTLAHALAELKDKGKGIMVEEHVKPKKKDQVRLDEETAKRLQAKEQEELTDVEKATLFMQLLEKRRKFFAAKRAEEKRNKPPTQAQQRKIMCTYLKNIEGYTLKQLKAFMFDKIQEMFDKAFKRQKVDDDKETIELKQLMEIIPDKEEVVINAIPLAVKSLWVVDWKIYKEG